MAFTALIDTGGKRRGGRGTKAAFNSSPREEREGGRHGQASCLWVSPERGLGCLYPPLPREASRAWSGRRSSGLSISPALVTSTGDNRWWWPEELCWLFPQLGINHAAPQQLSACLPVPLWTTFGMQQNTSRPTLNCMVNASAVGAEARGLQELRGLLFASHRHVSALFTGLFQMLWNLLISIY